MIAVNAAFAPLIFLLLGGGGPPAGGGAGVFPEIAGWRAAPPPGDSVYTPENLWDIIDGGAELFLSYGFVDLRIVEYTDSADTDVRVELYRHSSRENAFGIYSQERSPGYHFIGIGVQGYVEDKVLNFLCGTYYVKISSHRAGRRGVDAMELIGRSVAAHLGQDPGWPSGLALLPVEKRLPNTESYIAENFLGYRSFHSAFTARYEGNCTLFIMYFDSAAGAWNAAHEYGVRSGRELRVTEGEIADVADPHNGHVAIFVHGRALCGAFGPAGSGLVRGYAGILRTAVLKSRERGEP